MEHEQAAEVRSRAGLTDAKIPKRDRRRAVSEALPPYEIRTEITGHCRIDETEEEGTDRERILQKRTQKMIYKIWR